MQKIFFTLKERKERLINCLLFMNRKEKLISKLSIILDIPFNNLIKKGLYTKNNCSDLVKIINVLQNDKLSTLERRNKIYKISKTEYMGNFIWRNYCNRFYDEKWNND